MADLYEAIKARDTDKVAKLLLSPPSSPTESSSTAEVLWSEWTDQDGFSLLHWAAMGGVYDLILILVVDMKMDVNIRGPNLQTPLMWAAIEDRVLVMTLLHKLGAEIDARDDLGDNIITLAAQHERLYACLWGIRHGADINASNVTGSTAGHWAAFSGAYLMLAALDAFDANMSTSYDHYGLLPLHRALQLEYYATAKMLVELRPTLLEAKTKKGLNLHEFAQESDLSPTWFAEFINLCKDPTSHRPFAAPAMVGCDKEEGDKKPGEYVRTGVLSNMLIIGSKVVSLRRGVWNIFTSLLLKLEASKIGRIFIPILALIFAVIFTITWRLELSALNMAIGRMIRSLGGSQIEFLCTSIPPYLGVVAMGIFMILLIKDPGVVPKSKDRRALFGRVQDKLVDLVFICRLSGVKLKSNRFSEWLNIQGVNEKCHMALVYKQDEDLLIQKSHQKQAQCEIDPSQMCPTCWIMKDLRTKHCGLCDSCCVIMDHHCLWLNRCVGAGNHRLFFIFVICAAIAQAYHILLLSVDVLWLILTRWTKIPHPTGLEIPTNWQISLLIFLSACIHVTTYRWSLALVTSQISCVWDGYTINETLSLARYSHFLCRVVDREDGSEDLTSATILAEKEFNSTERRVVEADHYQEVVIGKSKNRWIRYFVRNPFTISASGFTNCLKFWQGNVPTTVDWELVAHFDEKYRQEILADIRSRRQLNL